MQNGAPHPGLMYTILIIYIPSHTPEAEWFPSCPNLSTEVCLPLLVIAVVCNREETNFVSSSGEEEDKRDRRRRRGGIMTCIENSFTIPTCSNSILDVLPQIKTAGTRLVFPGSDTWGAQVGHALLGTGNTLYWIAVEYYYSCLQFGWPWAGPPPTKLSSNFHLLIVWAYTHQCITQWDLKGGVCTQSCYTLPSNQNSPT